ncbi:tetratricopeptide repeat protein [Desulfocurvus sp.]|jgi:predicted Zn-dependent protease|uniref:type III secretion apparatus assembly chaperone SctY n=1 Tax=Desulfocurvus sp. TaxID=2871698 RepID=UPI0025C42396|nr:tetratricopeptide repeat protein [Desulfocurvus sp.]MCK9239978.1 hypothetical protein [Desulfocurvus sp.]
MLTRAQRDALFMLVYLYVRLGDTARARTILDALARACPGEDRTGKYLAGVALLEEQYERALALLAPYTSGPMTGTADAPLLLLKAKALWHVGRESESRGALDEYLYLVGAQR